MFNLALHDHLHLTFNEIIERHSAHAGKAHARAGAHLWDLRDGALAIADARLRRDRLMDELRAIYETTSVIALEHDVMPLEKAS